MIPRQRFIARIRSLGYAYKSTQKRTYLYRKAGGTHYLSVPMRDRLSETYVRSALAQAGCSESDIRAFLDDAASQ
ncbi:MAG: hypothetical protein OXF93_19615 [Acidobacteria bacterium]|nr:hypothetical protein [Acidobacteriota bacterium]